MLPRARFLPGALVLVALLALPSVAAATESCANCLDDDGDGAIDCWDRDCLDDPNCVLGPLWNRDSDPNCEPELRLELLWVSNEGSAYADYSVGDVDGDGVPEVVFVEARNVRILDGQTGALENEVSIGMVSATDASLADVDGDGTAEIFVGEPPSADGDTALARYEHDLSETFHELEGGAGLGANVRFADLSFADFDHDGTPEIYSMGAIHSTVDGAVLVDLTSELSAYNSGHAFAADFLPDEACALCSGLELAGSTTVWAVDVTTGAWERVMDGGSQDEKGSFAVADWNGDGLLDIIVSTHGHVVGGLPEAKLYVWDPRTGERLAEGGRESVNYSAGVPLVANFDDDLEPEVAKISSGDDPMALDRLVLLDNDFSLIWASEGRENSSWTTGVMFDFNLDGTTDIAHRGHSHISLFDGRDGTVLANAPCASGTATERLVVADLNADGQVDVLSGCSGTPSLVAYTVVNGPPARQVMNQWQYYPVVIDEDLTVPCHQQHHAAPGAPAFLNRSIQQAPLLREGLTPAEDCRCPIPVEAAAVAPPSDCGSSEVLLDASGATGCMTDRLYQWLDGEGTVVCDWSSDPTCLVMPLESTEYTVIVACAEDGWCHAREVVSVEVKESPTADAGPDRVICEGESVILDGSASVANCPTLEYRWSDEAGVLRDWDTDPTLILIPGRDKLYTVDVRCQGVADCEASDDAWVRLDDSPPGEPVGAILRVAEGTETSAHFDWCRGRPLGANEHAHLYRSETASGGFTLVSPNPHSISYRDCEWTDENAPAALYFYDLRYANCSDLVTESPWRERP